MALQLSIPIPGTNVNRLVHRVTGVQMTFNANGTAASTVVTVSSFVDNVALVPISTMAIGGQVTPAQVAGGLAFSYALLKADAMFAAAVTIADPA